MIFFITIKKGPEGRFSWLLSSSSGMASVHIKCNRELGPTSMVQYLPRTPMLEIQYSVLKIIFNMFKLRKVVEMHKVGVQASVSSWAEHWSKLLFYKHISPTSIHRLISFLVDKYLKISKNPTTQDQITYVIHSTNWSLDCFVPINQIPSIKPLSHHFFQLPISTYMGYFLVELEFYYIAC